MAPRRGKSDSLQGILRTLAKRYGWDEGLKEAQLEGGWAEVVGARVAAVTTLDGLRHGVLFVKVTTSTWRYELKMMSPQILEKLKQSMPNLRIDEIRWQ